MHASLQVDLALIRKYDRPAPRYTSYPTAVQFMDAVDPAAVAEDLGRWASPDRPLSLYFHLPFCESLCWFCGCTRIISHDHGRAAPYLDALAAEMSLAAGLVNAARPVTQFHFGGGTPNYLDPGQIDALGRSIHRIFAIAPGAEGGVEFDPRRLTSGHVAAFRRLGARRASIGVQDFDPGVQEAVNRIMPHEVAEQAARWIREEGYDSLNIDLIYGLPRQTLESLGRTIDQALALGPGRFATYSYAHVPWMRPSQKIIAGLLPPPELKLEMFKLVVERLTAAGFVYIGMDHFARPGDELAVAQRNGRLQRNFQGYSTHGGTDICAFGISAISQTPTLYRQNEKTLPPYYDALNAGRLPIRRTLSLSGEDMLRREVIMRLMCDLRIDYAAASQNLGVDFRAHFAREIAALKEAEADGLVRLHPDGIEVTDTGRILVRNLALVFDQYTGRGPSGVVSVHARAV